VRKRQIAGWACEDVAAVRAEEEGVEPAPVEEQERLFFLRQGLPERLDEPIGEEGRPALFVSFRPHIDHFDAREGAVVHAEGEGEVAVTAARRLKAGLDPRRCGTEDHRGPHMFPPDHGEIAGVVPQAVVLLVGGVVLFIHDDQAKIPDRRKKSRSGADDQTDIAAAELFPLIIPRALGDAAVNDGDLLLREPFTDAGKKLRREGDLRDKIDRAAAAPKNFIDGPEVHFGLAASRHAVEEAGGETPRGEAGPNFTERLFLCFIRFDDDVIPSDLRGEPRSPQELFLMEANNPLLFQRSEKGSFTETFGEAGNRQVAPFPKEVDKGCLFRGELCSIGNVFFEKSDPFFTLRPDNRKVQALFRDDESRIFKETQIAVQVVPPNGPAQAAKNDALGE
jgi:hypothetical protein